MAMPDRDTPYNADGSKRTVYETTDNRSTGWVIGGIIVVALLVIGYFVFAGHGGTPTSATVNDATPAVTAPATPVVPAPSDTTTPPATSTTPMTSTPAPGTPSDTTTTPSTPAPAPTAPAGGQ